MAAPVKFESSLSRHSGAAAERRDAREELLERLELAPENTPKLSYPSMTSFRDCMIAEFSVP